MIVIELCNSKLYVTEKWNDISRMLGIEPKECTNAIGIISNQSSEHQVPRFVCCTNKRACELTAEELQQMKQCCKELCPELELDGLCHTDIPIGRDNLLGDAWIEKCPVRTRKRRK